MLQNNNTGICRRLAGRELRFHKTRMGLFISAIAFVSALYLLVFLTGSGVKEAVLFNFKLQAGTMNQVTFHEISVEQAARLAAKEEVQRVVTMEPVAVPAMDLLDTRGIVMAVSNQDYAETIQSVPTTGGFPKTVNEIAMDVFSMDSLGIPRRVGEKARLSFRDAMGEVREQEFTISGYWTSTASMHESVFWVHEDQGADTGDGTVTAGVTLHRTKNPEGQAEKLCSDPALAGAAYTVNLAYTDTRIDNAASQAKPFYSPVIFVILCGLLMVFQITRITVESDVRLFGRMRALGMTKRQIRRLILEQGLFMILPGLGAGYVLGLLSYFVFLPLLVGCDAAMAAELIAPWPFLLTAFLALLTVLAAAALPAAKAQRISPTAAIRYEQRGKPRARSRKTTVFRLAADTLRRDKVWMALSVLATGCALLLLCTTWIRYISYDEDKYMESASYSDYALTDGSAGNQLQVYNPAGNSITEAFYGELEGLEGVEESGKIRTKEVELAVPDALYEREAAFYEGEGIGGMTRKEEMEYYPEWKAAYNRFLETKTCKAVVIGADGLALSKLLRDRGRVAGTYDEALFQTGGYTVAVGISSEDPNGSLPGETVVIGDRELKVMASYEVPGDLIPGADSREAAYSLAYIIPERPFETLFPEANIRAVLFNAAEGKAGEIDRFLTGYQERTGSGMGIVKRSDQQSLYHSAVFTNVSVDFLTGVVLVIIGGLIYLHMILSKTLYRSQELAVYESLGMSNQQLQKMLLAEGCLHMGVLFAILIPAVGLLTSVIMPYYYQNSNEWAYTYRFSLAPLWVCVLLYAVCSLPLALFGLRLLKRRTIADRLKQS